MVLNEEYVWKSTNPKDGLKRRWDPQKRHWQTGLPENFGTKGKWRRSWQLVRIIGPAWPNTITPRRNTGTCSHLKKEEYVKLHTKLWNIHDMGQYSVQTKEKTNNKIDGLKPARCMETTSLKNTTTGKHLPRLRWFNNKNQSSRSRHEKPDNDYKIKRKKRGNHHKKFQQISTEAGREIAAMAATKKNGARMKINSIARKINLTRKSRSWNGTLQRKRPPKQRTWRPLREYITWPAPWPKDDEFEAQKEELNKSKIQGSESFDSSMTENNNITTKRPTSNAGSQSNSQTCAVNWQVKYNNIHCQNTAQDQRCETNRNTNRNEVPTVTTEFMRYVTGRLWKQQENPDETRKFGWINNEQREHELRRQERPAKVQKNREESKDLQSNPPSDSEPAQFYHDPTCPIGPSLHNKQESNQSPRKLDFPLQQKGFQHEKTHSQF